MKFNLAFFIIAMTLISVSIEANTTAPKKLPLCLNTPNCVSSQADNTDKQHYIEPFKISGTTFDAWDALIKAINKHGRMVITHQTDDTLHAEATSLILHFVDDINAVLDNKTNLIHIRSASRTGHSDFGVNRKRIEELRMQLQKAHVIE